ncbi:hypothetical protein TNCV_1473271 [Trichonephila clavipes]|nr:hypothetical protein TNCV_1473271 [Trichonephila clavipes]
METPGFSFTPTPLGHEEYVGVGQPSSANDIQEFLGILLKKGFQQLNLKMHMNCCTLLGISMEKYLKFCKLTKSDK